mmetsp:Transcript_73633/g.204680  ORF Transcript_73633/g.204680 Transcript_73633/m.204680 type:complete len:415 (+) Transcript_73633:99-1343(+)
MYPRLHAGEHGKPQTQPMAGSLTGGVLPCGDPSRDATPALSQQRRIAVTSSAAQRSPAAQQSPAMVEWLKAASPATSAAPGPLQLGGYAWPSSKEAAPGPNAGRVPDRLHPNDRSNGRGETSPRHQQFCAMSPQVGLRASSPPRYQPLTFPAPPSFHDRPLVGMEPEGPRLHTATPPGFVSAVERLWSKEPLSQPHEQSPSVGESRVATAPLHKSLGASGGAMVAQGLEPQGRPASQPFACIPPPFYWALTVETIGEFEVSGACGEVVAKINDFEDSSSALPVAGTLRMSKGGLYHWTLQIVRQCTHRPQIQFGLHGANHARPWRLVSTGRCSRSRDDGPWLARPSGDMAIVEGDYVHCEADLRGVSGPLGSFSFSVNAGQMETVFEDIPLSEGPLQPVVLMGGAGTTCRLCPA